MEIVELCPICECKESMLFLTTKDFKQTQQEFKIVSCVECGFKYTNQRAPDNGVGGYYKFDGSVRVEANAPFGKIAQKAYRYMWLRIVSSFYKSGNFLDVGYETTALIDLFKHGKWNASGVSLKQLIESDFNTSGEQSRGVVLKEIETASVDVISLFHSFNKVNELNQLLIELKRILKPNGLILLALPNCNSWDANYFKEYWEAYNTPRNLYHFSPKDVNTLFRKNEMKVFRTLPMVYDSYKNSYWSEYNKSKKQSFLKSFFRGLVSNILAIKSGKSHSSQIYLISQ